MTVADHPLPVDIALLVEVSDSTLAYDRTVKLRSYARNYIQQYWLVDLVGRQVEVSEGPSGPTDAPAYASRQVFHRGEAIPLRLRDWAGVVAVDEVLPRV